MNELILIHLFINLLTYKSGHVDLFNDCYHGEGFNSLKGIQTISIFKHKHTDVGPNQSQQSENFENCQIVLNTYTSTKTVGPGAPEG